MTIRRRAIAAAAAVCLCASACTDNASSASSPAATTSVVAAASTAPTASGTVTLGQDIRAVTFDQVEQGVTTLWAQHPDIAAFAVDQVQYNATTRDKVLGVCRTGAAANDEQALQSAKVMACAPLIYFFYSYGTQHGQPQATQVADDLYDYAVTQITGPFNTQQTLNGLLRTWGVPVTNQVLTGTSGANSPTSQPMKDALVAAARTAMNTTSGVHISVTSTTTADHKTLNAEFDSGRTAATETLTSGTSTGQLRILANAAYFTGNPAGLAEFFGLPAKAAAKLGDRWVIAAAGTSQYTSLSAGTLIGSLPSTVLPATDNVTVSSSTVNGVAAYRLTWTAFAGTADKPILRTLDLAAAAEHLPLTQTSTSADGTQTATFTHWGISVAGSAPMQPTISFASASALS